MNPLFVDSTKFAGDKVVTSIELVDIVLNDEDSLFIEVKESSAASKRFAVKPLKTKKSVRYRIEILLKAKTVATYRFFVEHSGKEISSGETQAMNAGETICSQWQPIAKEQKNIESPKTKIVKPARSSPLLTKDTLDQIKLFVEE